MQVQVGGLASAGAHRQATTLTRARPAGCTRTSYPLPTPHLRLLLPGCGSWLLKVLELGSSSSMGGILVLVLVNKGVVHALSRITSHHTNTAPHHTTPYYTILHHTTPCHKLAPLSCLPHCASFRHFSSARPISALPDPQLPQTRGAPPCTSTAPSLPSAAQSGPLSCAFNCPSSRHSCLWSPPASMGQVISQRQPRFSAVSHPRPRSSLTGSACLLALAGRSQLQTSVPQRGDALRSRLRAAFRWTLSARPVVPARNGMRRTVHRMGRSTAPPDGTRHLGSIAG